MKPTDRQSESDINSASVNTGDSASAISKASEITSAPRDGQQMSDDDMLLHVIEMWATLTPVRRRMIVTLAAR